MRPPLTPLVPSEVEGRGADAVPSPRDCARDERKFAPSIFLLLLLAACSIGGDRKARRAEPPNRPTAQSAETRACLARLGPLASYQALPDRDFGGGCYAFGAVKLLNVGVPVANLGALTCPLAATFAAWIRNGAMPAARVHLGTELVRVETFGTYSCRTINGGGSGRLSEHATANAVDVSGFVLADGRRITVKQDWASPDPQVRAFMLAIRTSACRRFRTVLSPDYNRLHEDHFHLDMGRGPFCR